MALAALAVLGQQQAVGRALQQAQAQLPFQGLKPTADGGLGGAQLHGGGRKAAAVDDAQEGTQQVQAVAARCEIVHAYGVCKVCC